MLCSGKIVHALISVLLWNYIANHVRSENVNLGMQIVNTITQNNYQLKDIIIVVRLGDQYN